MPVRALKGISLEFDRAEFVSVLGHSGCGKTTMLNIIGGLDRYTEGDLVIDGVSTKDYTDRDWDAYRNHSVGFVFQNYNLIPHQTVVKNVELALTLSGVDKETRRKRAIEALELVGLKDQINKLPNQLSGGQMQRVAIARAIVNDPEIILADEPTGALDSETSVQVMEILKDLSMTRLVIMVTHNAELAEKYSTRIVTLSDGLIVGDAENGDSKDITECETPIVSPEKKTQRSAKKPSMSLLTAFSLSLNNLFTKKGRTILTAFAGSIGIIGIALILSLSAGFNTYINNVQRDTLSNYPITITTNTVDYTSMVLGFMGGSENTDEPSFPDDENVTMNGVIENILTTVIASLGVNDLKPFKEYLDANFDPDIISAISYSYGLQYTVYGKDGDGYKQIIPAALPNMETILPGLAGTKFEDYYYSFGDYMNQQGAISEMIDNRALLNEQYDVLQGHWPSAANEIILVVDQHNRISDLMMYMIGLQTDYDIAYVFEKLLLEYQGALNGLTEEQIDEKIVNAIAATGLYEQQGRTKTSYTFDELMDLELNLVIPVDTCVRSETQPKKVPLKEDPETQKVFPLWRHLDEQEISQFIGERSSVPVTEGGTRLKISGIVRLKQNVTAGSLTTPLCYTKALSDLILNKTLSSEIVIQQLDQVNNVDYRTLFEDEPWGAILDLKTYLETSAELGIADPENPTSISIYPVSFESKNKVIELIEAYNASHGETEQIKYNDYIGLMMSSITDIINAVTYVLIAFVSISLIVSSIMISVITHISVLERTKEIGVLRSIGASKRDISRVFNAETAIIGLTSGVLGILITIVLNIPISLIIDSLSGLKDIAVLPVWGAFMLIAISTLLTILAGLIPASKASKQDPVIALRSE